MSIERVLRSLEEEKTRFLKLASIEGNFDLKCHYEEKAKEMNAALDIVRYFKAGVLPEIQELGLDEIGVINHETANPDPALS